MTKFSRETIKIRLKKELESTNSTQESHKISNGPFHMVMPKVGVSEGEGGIKSSVVPHLLLIAITHSK